MQCLEMRKSKEWMSERYGVSKLSSLKYRLRKTEIALKISTEHILSGSREIREMKRNSKQCARARTSSEIRQIGFTSMVHMRQVAKEIRVCI